MEATNKPMSRVSWLEGARGAAGYECRFDGNRVAIRHRSGVLQLQENKSINKGSIDTKHLERQLTRNWYLLGAISIASCVGLAIALAPTLTATLNDFWPWGDTNLVLLGALVIALTGLVAYLTYQQRKIGAVREHIERMEMESRKAERRQKERMHALVNVSRMMGAVADLETMFKTITEMCIEMFECEQASLMVLNPGTEMLEVRAATGHEKDKVEMVKRATQRVGEGIAGWVAQHQCPLNLSPGVDMSQYGDLKLTRKSIIAAMVVPIVVRDELVGVLSVSSRNESTIFSAADLEALGVFAENAGSCIRHSERAAWMRKMIENQKGTSVTGLSHAQPKPEPTS
jgi:uncharacterized protein YigA (DUF484 family)